MKTYISKWVTKEVPQLQEDEVCKYLEIPADGTMGDFALPCFFLAKEWRKAPKQIAEEVVQMLNQTKDETIILSVEAVNGYVNFHLNKAQYVKVLLERVQQEQFGVSQCGIGKTICMDYSSPNIAKNFHVGHLRTTVIGNSLYQIFKKQGYQVVRINYLGDWGTQFGKLIVAYKNWSSKELVEEKGIEELLRIYVKFNEEADKNPSLIEEARQWFGKMEQQDEEAIQIWSWFKEISLVEFERIYNILEISFDSYSGESVYMSKVPELVKELQEKNLLQESEGAQIIDLSAEEMPPCLIIKSNGSTIYTSRDLAAIFHRKELYQFDKCIYVTGSEQALHFKQVFKVIEKMGYDWSAGLIHVPYGLVSMQGAKLSSRTGNIVYAEDILLEAINRSKELIEKKNPSLQDKDVIAKQVGVGAVIFHDLFTQRIKNIDFSWEAVLSFEGNSGPYVQYTYARAKSILRKNKEEYKTKEICYDALTDSASYELIKKLADYPSAVAEAAKQLEPSVLAKYTISVATLFNKFYQENNILNAEEHVKKARLHLVNMTQMIIQECCNLLGITCPEEM